MTTTQETSLTRTVREIFTAVDSGEAEAVCAFLTDDVHFRFGSAEAIDSKAEVEAMSRAFDESIAGIRHEILDMWQVADDTVVCLLDVHYERLDGKKLTLPCSNFFRFRDGLVDNYRIYMDVNPVFAA
ncbi:nuclear transport factor 2 family protein [Streptomyces sp. NPDC059909]|uniref:nuclear transport factor 2 family protein n=1 Tax=Streptomyces sp. NPDC059909 TaxID=3346998 RepID=UPI003666199B